MARVRALASVKATLSRSVLAVAFGDPTPIQTTIPVLAADFQPQPPSLYFEDFFNGLRSSFGSFGSSGVDLDSNTPAGLVAP